MQDLKWTEVTATRMWSCVTYSQCTGAHAEGLGVIYLQLGVRSLGLQLSDVLTLLTVIESLCENSARFSKQRLVSAERPCPDTINLTDPLLSGNYTLIYCT